jgi:HflK protein
MTGFLAAVLWETWEILMDAGVFLIAGFLLAGILAVFTPKGLLNRLVGTGRVRSVLWGAVLGAPLPLCSCGVLPTALGLRKEGATPGATVAFLVATPETGADSISLTYAFTDVVMTVFRPVAGVVTGVAAGLATNFFGVGRQASRAPEPHPAARMDDQRHGNGPDHEHAYDHGHVHAHERGFTDVPLHASGNGPSADVRAGRAAVGAAEKVLRYAFVDLMDDISHWFVLGIVLSAIASVAVPEGILEGAWAGGAPSMLFMLAISVPLYTCAASSTPLVAALALKGLSPGAALVFLIAGPATNIGSVVVLMKALGGRVVAVYLAAVAAMALAAGFALNALYQAWGIDPRLTFGAAQLFLPWPVKAAGALLLTGLLIRSLRRTPVPQEWMWLQARAAGIVGIAVTARALKAAAVSVAALLWLGDGLFEVGPGETGIRSRFGRIIESNLAPGLHFRWPWPLESDRVVAQDEIRRIEFGQPPRLSREASTRAQLGGRLPFAGNAAPGTPAEGGMWFQKVAAPDDSYLLTGDANLIDLRTAVEYRVKDARSYAYGLADPQALMRSTVRTALRGVVASRPIDDVYTSGRADIERRTREHAQIMLDRYRSGMEIVSFRLLYDHPPDEVHDAFRDVASAQEDKLRTINLANVFAVEKINQARGDAAGAREAAQAYKDQRVAAARADAAAFLLRMDAWKRAPELTQFRLQMESIESVLPGVRKLIRPGAGDVRDFDLWLLQPPGIAPEK